jgi:hypothetical protein
MQESAPVTGNCTSHPIRAVPHGGTGAREGGLQSYPALVAMDNGIIQSYVPTIFQTERSNIYGSGVHATNSMCGQLYRTVKTCSFDHSHHMEYRHIYCNDPLCPVCYVKFVKRLSERVAERVLGYKELYPEDPLSHVTFSPPEGTRYKDERSAFADVTKVFLENGGKAGIFWCHWYRMPDQIKAKLRRLRRQLKEQDPDKDPPGFWKLAHDDALKLGHLEKYVYYSPHFHGIVTGYLLDSETFHGKTGWIYKKIRFLKAPEEIAGLAYYLSSHASWEWTKHSVRYVGDMSYSKMARRDKITERIQEVCPKCGSLIETHYLTDDGKVGDLIEGECLKKVEKWLYYKRVKKPKRLKSKQSGLKVTG